ncbi:MAG: hypothetical protein RMZ42_00215 [Nostoc sp. DedQUE05]|uniref:hypothetical protein n=1 Tax=Nostoc sp. DedQUE05 TaxID=3075391 RepID=UPI002AD3B17F|nr:hypothetical protein [Nostoc sp. DedQUE05]MDZ8090364.1 hypothetical protein [Nostoc sp. DedQUE05]
MDFIVLCLNQDSRYEPDSKQPVVLKVSYLGNTSVKTTKLKGYVEVIDIKMIFEAHALELKTKYYAIFQDGCCIMAAFDMIASKTRLIA